MRTDTVGRANGFDKPRDPQTGIGGCNACSGLGKVEDWEKSYPFDVENLREFIAFLRDCGGFAIS